MSRSVSGLLICIWVVCLTSLSGQTPTGTIQGIITDSSGAAVPEAKVVINNVNTNESRTLRTDATGRYVQPFLLTGTYVITVEKEGFRAFRQENVKLDVGQNRSVDLTLEVGAISQQVVVEGTPPPVDTNTSSIGQVIENKRIMDLPLNGRSSFSLANLTPGVNPTGGGATPGMGGGRNAMSELQIDGMTDIAPENNVGINNRVYEPQVDSVAEFNVQVNSLAAEYGRFAGGVINVATKSGTNQLHGTAYDFLRNSLLDANSWSNNKSGRQKGSFKRNQWGGVVGGPILIPGVYNGRDKSFFFAGFEGNNQRSASSYTNTMPITAWKNGDFSNFRTSSGTPILIYDPLTVRADPNNPGKYIRDPFLNNTIPSSRIDPVAAAMAKYWPDPNLTPGNVYTNVNNFYATGVGPNDSYRVDTRWDQNWTERWRMFARVSVSWGLSQPFNGFGNLGTSSGSGPTKSGSRQVSIDHTYTFSPSLIGNFRYGFGRTVANQVPISDGIDLTKLGFSQAYASTAALRGLEFPNVSVGGNISIAGLGQAGWTRLFMAPMVHSLTGSITKITSRHTFKFGGEFRVLMLNFAQYGYPSGSYTFNAGWTQQEIQTSTATAGNGLASFLLGLPSGGYMTHEPTAASTSKYFAGYIQDDWKLTSRLTLNIGLRYDVDLPRTERFNRMSYFDATAPSPIQGKVPASACAYCGNLRGAMQFVTPDHRSQVPNDLNNFGPRIGFSWNFARNSVLRAGYGIAYPPSAIQAAGTSGTAGMEGFSTNSNVNATFDTMRTVYAYLRNPYPDGFNMPTGSAMGTSTNLGMGVGDSYFNAYKNPYVQQWNANLQHSLPGGILVEVGYIGNRGIGLVDGETGTQYNQLPASSMSLGSALIDRLPNPFLGLIPYTTSSLYQPTVSRMQLLRPYPQLTGLQSYRKPIAQSSYHGMTIRADKRFSHGFSLLLAYTAAKMIDDASSAVSFIGSIAGTHLDTYNRKLEKSLSSFDVSQRAVISYVYEFPIGKGKRLLNNLPAVANLIVTGWQANGITTFQTGLPVYLSGITNNTGIGTSSQRANTTGTSANMSSVSRSTDAKLLEWFDISTFSQPAAYTFGTVGRTLPDVRNPGTNSTDLSFFKNSYFGPEQRMNLQYRIEMFSAFNHPQWSGPGNTINTGSFGVISGASGSRTIQMALKLIW